MPETPEQLWERAAGNLRMPPVEGWQTFPFDGDLRPRALEPPGADDYVAEPGDIPDDLAPELGVLVARIFVGSFAAIWDDVLPPTPEDVWRSNLEALRSALGRG